jgi:AbrB family looped-hinge helix DNA binding protein
MRITSKGQVTIPQDVREKAGLLPHTEVDIVLDGDIVKIVKCANSKGPSRADMLMERMRRNRHHFTMTTDELMALTRGEE